MSERVDMWRLRIAKGNGSSGSGEWSYHESRDALESALFSAAVEAESHRPPKTNEDMHKRHRWNNWRRANGGEDKSSGQWVVQRIVAVENLVDGEWVEMPWSISPPVLSLGEVPAGRSV